MRTEPALQGRRYSVLLDFENQNNLAFVSAEPSAALLDQDHAHTGKNSLALPVGSTKLTVDLSSLLSGRPFPADWTLAGAYFLAAHDCDVIVSYQLDGQIVTRNCHHLPGGKWTAAYVDLTAAGDLGSSTGKLVFEFAPLDEPIYCDDVLLVDNDQTIFDDTHEPGAPDLWSVTQHGFSIVVQRPGGLKKTIKTPDAIDNGWTLEEVSAIRARFSSKSTPSTMVIYADGRQYVDGVYDDAWVVSDPWSDWYLPSHEDPAEVTIPAEEGRLDRNTAGDVHNLGYSQRLGCYEVVAFGRHLEIRIAPTGGPMARPVFEIAGLPQGKVLATLEGELIETTAWLADGNLLIELPAKVLRPAMLNVRVE